ncbi:hypothetical protein FRC18_003618 [Serendipita sp. 400]|nr:hypothetical protein FRC18_003618 [Serendipita sp. 400]
MSAPPLPPGRGSHMRSVSGGPPTSAPPTIRSHAPPPRTSSYGVAGNMRSAVADAGPVKRIPSPPPTSGQHKFPNSNDFPQPRKFERIARKYPSGKSRGSDFDLSVLG